MHKSEDKCYARVTRRSYRKFTTLPKCCWTCLHNMATAIAVEYRIPSLLL